MVLQTTSRGGRSEAVKLRNKIAEKTSKILKKTQENFTKNYFLKKKWQKVQINPNEVKSVYKIRQLRLNKSKVTKKLRDWKTISIT